MQSLVILTAVSAWNALSYGICWAEYLYYLIVPSTVSYKWKARTGSPVRLRWMIEAPTKLTLDGISFRTWPEFEGHEQPNFLMILVLAWSYILSARVVELQGQDGSRIEYTRSIAPFYCGPESVSSFLVVCACEQCGGSRLLAPGSGFQVSLLQKDSYNHHAPWESFLVAPPGSRSASILAKAARTWT